MVVRLGGLCVSDDRREQTSDTFINSTTTLVKHDDKRSGPINVRSDEPPRSIYVKINVLVR